MSGYALPQRQKPKVCGKFKTYRAHRDAATPLPAVSLREKGGVLMGSGICRILPTGGSGSAGKNRDRPTRPRFYASATCGFVTENLVVLGGFRFFPALPELMPQTESSSNSGSIRDNIQLSWKRQKAVGGNPDNDPSLPLPDVESATTGLCSNLCTRSGNYSSAISTSRPAEALRSFAYSSPHEL